MRSSNPLGGEWKWGFSQSAKKKKKKKTILTGGKRIDGLQIKRQTQGTRIEDGFDYVIACSRRFGEGEKPKFLFLHSFLSF